MTLSTARIQQIADAFDAPYYVTWRTSGVQSVVIDGAIVLDDDGRNRFDDSTLYALLRSVRKPVQQPQLAVSPSLLVRIAERYGLYAEVQDGSVVLVADDDESQVLIDCTSTGLLAAYWQIMLVARPVQLV